MERVKQPYFHSRIKLEADKEISHKVETTCLIGKIILDRPLYKDAVKYFTRREWKCKKDYVVSEIKRNIFMFSFQDKEDCERVLLDGPWTIMRGLLILSPWTAPKIPEELEFSRSPFWVQVHGLPLNYLTRENGLKIGKLWGEFVRVDGKAFDAAGNLWRKFLRIRVVIDITRPLVTGFWLRRTTLPDILVELKYENLGLFCYRCGRIGSGYRNCKFPAGKAKFGPWLCSAAESWGDARNPGTPLIEPILIRSSNAEISGEMEPLTHNCREDALVVPSFLVQRLIMNSLDSVTMMANCAVIYSRVGRAQDEYKGSNWKFFMVVAAYFFYLVMKLIRVTRNSYFLNSYSGRVAIEVDKFMALVEILILLLFFGVLKSC